MSGTMSVRPGSIVSSTTAVITTVSSRTKYSIQIIPLFHRHVRSCLPHQIDSSSAAASSQSGPAHHDDITDLE